MDGTDRKGFHYHAAAHVLSGEFWRPIQHVIDVQAPSVLPSTGGVGNSRVDNFRRDDLVSFKTGYSHVMGSKKRVKGKDGKESIVHTTQVTSTVEGLNILDVVTADRIVARVTSRHDADQEEGHIILVGSKFENLRIAGCEVHVKLHHELFLNLGTFAAARSKFSEENAEAVRTKLKETSGAAVSDEAVKKELEQRKEFRTMARETLQARHPDAEYPAGQVPAHGALLCSLVEKIEFKHADVFQATCAGVERRGRHAFHVRDFGTIFVGEVLFAYGQKTVTMLRLELGSPCDAGMNVVEAFSNGRPTPP
jgi:hypothetical protein